MRGRPRTSCEVVDFDGREWLYLRSIPVDVAIIRATTADEIRQPLVRGRRRSARASSIRRSPPTTTAAWSSPRSSASPRAGRCPRRPSVCPGIVVDAIVVAPDQLQTTQTVLLPEAAGHYRAPISELELAPWGPEKVVARRASQELRDGEAVNLGFGISALVPRVLLEEGLDGSVTWVIEQGAVGGVPFLGFQFGCAQNPDALLASPDQFTYLQGGGFDRALLSFLEVDADGNVNVSRLNAKPHVTAGVGGFVDITARAKRIVFSGFFTAGAQLAIEDGQIADRQRRQASALRSGGPARDLQRSAGPRTRSGGGVRHRALRDPAPARRPDRHRDRPGHQRRRATSSARRRST